MTETAIVPAPSPITVTSGDLVEGLEVYRRALLGGAREKASSPALAEILLLKAPMDENFQFRYFVRTTTWVGQKDDGVPRDLECDGYSHARAAFELAIHKSVWVCS